MKNRYINMFVCFVCSLMMFFGCVGSSVYYASTDDDAYLHYEFAKSQFINYGGEGLKDIPLPSAYGTTYLNFSLWGSNGEYYCFLTNDDFFDVTVKTVKYDGVSHYSYSLNGGSSGAYKLYGTSDNGANWKSYGMIISIGCVNVDTYAIFGNSAKYCYSSVPISINGNVIFNGNEGITPKESYNRDLGYLKNVKDKTQSLTDSSGTSDMSSMKRIIIFDSVSTTGVDLTSGDYVVRIYGQMAFRKNGSHELVNEDFPMVHYGDVDASSGRIEYNVQSLFDMVSVSAENPYNAFDTVFGQIIRSDNVYYQIYNKNTGEYGGYVKGYMGVNGSSEEKLYTSVDNEFKVDDSGYVDYDAPSSVGSGTTWEDAELNDMPSGSSNTDYSDFSTSINSMISGLTSVTKGFSALFGFLPPWCLEVFGVSVGGLGLVLLYKAIRG